MGLSQNGLKDPCHKWDDELACKHFGFCCTMFDLFVVVCYKALSIFMSWHSSFGTWHKESTENVEERLLINFTERLIQK